MDKGAAAARAALQLLLLGQRLDGAAIDDELNGRWPIRLLRGALRGRAARRALLDSSILEVAHLAVQRLLVGDLAGTHQLLPHQKRQRQQQQRPP